jgi:hypothetical protein
MKKSVKFEELVLIGIAVICFLTAIADFVGILHSVELLSERIPGMTLLFLSAIAAYMIGERRGKLNDIEMLTQSKAHDILNKISDNHTSISSLIKDGNTTLHNNPEETYNYFVERLSKAHTSIDVTHFEDRPYCENEPDYFKKIEYYKTLGEIIKSGKVKVRRIQLVRDIETLEWTKQVLKEFEYSTFRLGCYIGEASDIPLLSLMVIDGEEVCLACVEKNSSFDQKSMSIKNPILTQIIQNYFDILWRNSLVVKEQNINPHLLTEIEGKIKQQLVHLN